MTAAPTKGARTSSREAVSYGGGDTTGENAKRIQEGIDLFNQGNLPKVLELYDPEVHVESSGTLAGGTFRGREGVAEWFQKIGNVWPEGVHLKVENLEEAGDRVFVEWTSEGKLSNGKHIALKALNVFEFRGDKVKSQRLYTDSEKIMRDLGKM